MSEEYDDDRYITLENLNWAYDWVGIDNETDILLEELQNKLSDTRGLLLEACFTFARLKGKAYERNNT